ncbi:Ankyrin repeat domain containing protein [Pandoravirus salinus]|uniref:Ankyrin repeat domain containing protein n=1 Tax=Pandoravirus salinus TaxID=1349410 RepID=S4W0D0_9VIRU|nr:ankyrin repeat domain [Pandoravirus salinus]AGO85246.1 Ankyrin repeat domain containing protein [Pandoravirus salinus]
MAFRGPPTFDDLPVEVVDAILSRLPCIDRLGTAALVCKTWAALTSTSLSLVTGSAAFTSAKTLRRLCTMIATAEATCGHVHCLLDLRDRKIDWSDFSCALAASQGHLACLQFLHAQGSSWNGEACAQAAGAGQLDCLRYMVANGCPWTETALEMAIARDRDDCLRFLLAQPASLGLMSKRLCERVVRAGHVRCLRVLYEYGCSWGKRTCEKALKHDRVDCLRYLYENGCPAHESICYKAIEAASVNCLDYLLGSGHEWPDDASYAMGYSRASAVIAYTEQRGLGFDRDVVLARAVETDNLLVLDYARTHGWPWDARLCATAARFSSVKTLRYLRKHGCPWDERTTAAAIVLHTFPSVRIKCLVYARTQGCPWTTRTRAALRSYLAQQPRLKESKRRAAQRLLDDWARD